jgi:hypothetical protein
MEACVVRRPLVVVRTKSDSIYDPFDTVKTGAAREIKNVNKLERNMNELLQNNVLTTNQRELIKSVGLTIDGMAAKRIQDRIETL